MTQRVWLRKYSWSGNRIGGSFIGWVIKQSLHNFFSNKIWRDPFKQSLRQAGHKILTWEPRKQEVNRGYIYTRLCKFYGNYGLLTRKLDLFLLQHMNKRQEKCYQDISCGYLYQRMAGVTVILVGC